MRIDTAAYYGGCPCQVWPDAKGEDIDLCKDFNYFQTSTQIQPSLPSLPSFEVWSPTGRFETACFAMFYNDGTYIFLL